jgi:hypothetical protein
MADEGIETLPYSGESPQSRFAFERYMDDVKRGKGALQLKAVAAEMNAEIGRAGRQGRSRRCRRQRATSTRSSVTFPTIFTNTARGLGVSRG